MPHRIHKCSNTLYDYVIIINTYVSLMFQWRYSPTGPWPTERPPPVSEASANIC